ncbi:MAG TPA: DUF6603 domain-containing protein [Pyrinomonadaceae bacterium]|nr:DUF6603 domain-containing protein [Pyrinomonadaceae bacterium]
MSDRQGTFELIGEHLALALRPLSDSVHDPELFKQLMYRLGWNPTSLPPAYADLATAVDAALDKLDALPDNPPITDVMELIGAVKDAFNAIQSINVAPPGVDATTFLAEIGDRLFEVLLTDYLASQLPAAYNLLLALNVIVVEQVDAEAGRPSFIRVNFKWAEIPKIITEPLELPKRVYGWGTAEFDAQKVIDHLGELFFALRFPVRFSEPDEELVRGYADLHVGPEPDVARSLILPFYYITIADKQVEAAFVMRELPPANGKLRGLILEPQIPSEFPLKLRLADTINLRLRAGTNAPSLFGILIRPSEISFKYPFAPGLPPPSAGVGIGFDFTPAEPVVLFGAPGETRLEFKDASVDFSGSLTGSELDVLLGADLKNLALVFDTSTSDSFLKKIIGDGQTRIELALGVEWSSRNGVQFKGSGAFEVSVHPHLQLGPISIDEVTIRLVVPHPSPPDLRLEIGAGISGRLGPLAFVVMGIGLRVDALFQPGNVGPMDLQLGFKPPNGLGLSLDVGGFKGGGFLLLDNEKGEYIGALEIDFKGLFSLKAIGIINTKMPDGKKGFSLLIVIAAEFTPIQLTFGFTLNGVGGIFGLNRRIAVAALAEGIRTNAIKSILFPENVVANIARIISDIKQFFPQQKDHFVIGPMAKLGWGTPSIITVELGLLLDLPDPMFAIVGVLKALLPNEAAPILRLQVNFIGVVDFDRGYIFFRADLFDSRLLVYSITGSMAFLVSWGEAKALALSVGGFHPDFRDIPSIPALPDGFRRMARIGISLLSDENPRLKIESYFAITANTLQFGAQAELYAEQSGFNIYGFLGFDVLFIRDPLSFVAKLSGGIALRRHSSVIAGVNISATLTGPTPWEARGKATLSFLFFSISVGFHATWGSIVEAILGAVEDLLKVLQRELADTRNWRADLPPNNHLHVSLREIKLPADTDMLVIHPAGVLTFNQRSLPLEDFSIAKFGSKKPLAQNRFKLSGANSHGQEIAADYQGVREQFAPANFLELSDSEKLSRKSFDNLPSGFKLTATADLLTTLPVVRNVDYELSYLRRERIVPRGLIKLFVLAYDRLVKGSAVRQSGLAQQQTRVSLNAPAQVGLPPEAFVIANTADLKSHVTNGSGPMLFATQAEAYQKHQDLIAQNPALAGQIQVVSHFELNPN